MNKTNPANDPNRSDWSRDDRGENPDLRNVDADGQSPGPAANPAPMTPSLKTKQPADAPLGEPGENEEERLDEALQESMGTSDPVSIKIA